MRALALTWLNPHVYLDTVLLVSHRHYRINPILREAVARGDKVIGAPPLWGSLYHAAFGFMVFVLAVSTAQRMVFEGQTTIGVWLMPFAVLFGMVATRMFARHYSKILREYEHHHYR